MKLIIIRGPSGSGKSTIAKHLGGVANVNWLEADMFFMQNGTYQFDLSRIGDAYSWCRQSVKAALNKGLNTAGSHVKMPHTIIVSNTSTTTKELNEYLTIAKEVGLKEVQIIRTPEPWNVEVLFKRNAHRVPFDTIKRQIMRYEPHDDEVEWSNMEIFNVNNHG